MYDQYDALIFDMDGTLIESGKLHELAWRTALDQFSIPIDARLMQSLAGVPTLSTVEILIDHYQIDLATQAYKIAAAKEQYINQHKTRHLRPTKLANVAQHYYGKKPMAVGTGANLYEAKLMLESCGIVSLFDHIVAADHVDNHKPAPDTFLLAAELMNVEPASCLVFEDSPLGIQAAKKAGMTYIDVQKELGIINVYFTSTD